MKTIWRTLIILTVAVMVCGVVWAWAGTGTIQAVNDSGRQRPENHVEMGGNFPPPNGEGHFPGGPGGGGRGDLHGREGLNGGLGWTQLIKNTLVVASLVLGVSLISQLITLLRRWRQRRSQAALPSSGS